MLSFSTHIVIPPEHIIITKNTNHKYSSSNSTIPNFGPMRPSLLKIKLILIILISLIIILTFLKPIPLILIIFPTLHIFIPPSCIHTFINPISTNSRIINISFLWISQYLICLFQYFKLLLCFFLFVMIWVKLSC